MNIERDKFLTEAMGECWHEFNPQEVVRDFLTCINCNCYGVLPNNNFSTWEGFGKLWEWAIEQSWWDDLYITKFEEPSFIFSACQCPIDRLQNYMHPDNFADALYIFLKEKL